jgi:hypothetical protein
MSSLTTNFNVPPYFDDYDEAKKYYRILFRPSVALQARELTQLQTIQQKQVERFGGHVFKDGSVVEGCAPTTLPDLNFVRLENTFILNPNYSLTSVTSDYLLVGQTSQVRATLVIAKEGTTQSYPDTNIFYVNYLSTDSVNNTKTVFDSGEIIKIYNAQQDKLGTLNEDNLINTIRVVTASSSVAHLGKGYGFKIESGIIYQKGFFQLVDDQVLIIKPYDQSTGNYVVGFETLEEIIDENVDETLNDNALGYPNENAPGANRLKLTPYAVVKQRDAINENDSFFTVFEFSNISNGLVLNKTKSSYDELGDRLNNRTFEESGDYVTKPFSVQSVTGADPSQFNYEISSGVGYVRGSRIEYLSSNKIQADRATATLENTQQIITANYGNFIYIKEVYGSLNFSSYITIDIFNSAYTAVSRRFTNVTPGTKIGTAKVKAILYDSGGPAGSSDAIYRLYISNIVMNSGRSFSEARAFYAGSSVNTFGNFYADIEGSPILQSSGKNSLVFPFGKNALKTLRSQNGASNDTEFYYRTSTSTTLQTDGLVAVTTTSSHAGGFDQLAYSITTNLGDVLENDISVTLADNVASANIAGLTVAIDNGANTILGTGFSSRFGIGEHIRVYTQAANYDGRITNVTDTVLTVNMNAAVTNTACNFAKLYPIGYTIPLKAGYPGNRQVAVTGETTMEIQTGAASAAALLTSAPVVVQYRMRRSQATQAKKTVRKDVYVKLWANTAVNNSWNLGLTDVFKIKKVYANSTAFSTTGTDITDNFTLDTGQRLDYYDHARISLKSQFNSSTYSNEYFTVVLDHFIPDYTNGIGFFSVDSYPIDDVNLANTAAIQTPQIPIFNYENTSINLRDAVDFRPSKINSATSALTLAAASVNPGTLNTFVTLSTRYLVEPDSNFQADIEYYLARKDLVTLSIAGALGVIQGIPSENPRTPENNTDTMVIATVDVPAYPSLTANEAEIYNKPDDAIDIKISTNRVYTMRDIGVLDQRIQNLEYYTSLIALELAAKDLAVQDADGLNRFKNGIFVDPMNSYDFQETVDPEYRFTLDQSLKYGRSLFNQKTIDLMYNESASTGIKKTGRYLTRTFTEELFINQVFATKFRNNAQDFWSWQGSLSLYPGFDVNKTVQQGATSDTNFRIFINSRNISFIARGLRPNTTIYPYFDEVAVAQHCAPGTLNTSLGATIDEVISEANARGRPEDILIRSQNFGTALTTDSTGTLFGIFRIPPDTFRVGDRKLKLLDINDLTLGDDAILTSADAIFTAYNIDVSIPPPPPPPIIINITNITNNVTNVNNIINNVTNNNVTNNNNVINNNVTNVNNVNNINRTRNIRRAFNFNNNDDRRGKGRDPLAQSFSIVAPDGESGVFVTKLELFFKSRDPNLGLEIVIVGMENGVPNYNDVKGTSKLTSSQVNVSEDSSAATIAAFDFPVFLSSNKDYAFFVLPEANSPNYQQWVSEIGNFDIITGAQIFQNPYSGEMFRSSNAQTWTPIPTEDMKFNLYVANFNVGTGTAYFENETDDYLTLSSIVLKSPTRNILVGDEVYVIDPPSETTVTIPTEYRTKQAFVQSVENGKITLNNSKGVFRTSQIIGIFAPPQQGNVDQCNYSTLIATATIASVDNPTMHGLIPKILSNVISGTSVNFSFKGTSSSNVVESNYNDVSTNVLKELIDYERKVCSYSNETLNSLGKTFVLKANMNNSNKYVSPIIDLVDKSVVVVENDINNDNTNENTRNGNARARYISKPVVLADGQDSEDMLVYLTGYRPINTDILVYAKYLNGQDPATLDVKPWTKLNLRDSSLRSSSANQLDFKEFIFELPSVAPISNDGTAYKNSGNFGIMEYIDINGAKYITYKSFVLKIVLLCDINNKIYVPKVDDIRVIALQV